MRAVGNRRCTTVGWHRKSALQVLTIVGEPVLCAGGVDVIAATPMEETVKREFEELFREHFQFVYCTAYTVNPQRALTAKS